ncbi:dienelactone hydrolase family protein [Nocardioides allogilvus]|uniref:dienelactone hydrolase family protein n=1 Tax=Nocardioides allogilvus TaxID=2072017 RepID=UPI0013004DD0
MVTVLLFPSVLGVRAGITDTAERLRAAGHDVRVVDVLEGRTFDDYEPAMSHQRSLPDGQLHALATTALEEVSGPFVTVGFSSGCALAEWSAAQRPRGVRGVVLVGGALPMQYVEASWPSGVPAQTHATRNDPFDDGPEVAAEFRSDVEAAGGDVEVFTYDGSGHLFNDPSLPAEFQPADAEQFYDRLLELVARWPE